MVVHCFCSRCGRELHRASTWKPPVRPMFEPVRPMFEEDAPVLLPIEPCEHCAPRNEGRRLAAELLRKALADAEADSGNKTRGETPKDGLEPRPQLPEEDE